MGTSGVDVVDRTAWGDEDRPLAIDVLGNIGLRLSSLGPLCMQMYDCTSISAFVLPRL